MALSVDDIREIRNLLRTIVDHVEVRVYRPQPSTDMQFIGENEDFSVRIEARNTAYQSIQLINVRWYVRMAWGSEYASFIVPDPPMVARASLGEDAPELTPGTEQNSMYLFPSTPFANHLYPGDIDDITIQGRSSSLPFPQFAQIEARIFADIDMDYLFPKNESTGVTRRYFSLMGPGPLL